VTERTAYLVFLTAVGTGLGLLTVALIAVAAILWRQHQHAKQREP
jgi:hypothetical protein